MSFDLNLTTACDHLVFRELTVLDKDARTIHLQNPIAATATVQVFATDNLVPDTMYRIINNPTETVNPEKIIQFKDKWRSITDYFEISYITLPNFCPKCSGINFYDDISYDVSGDLFTIRDEKLLMQNVEKFTVTKINSNPFHT